MENQSHLPPSETKKNRALPLSHGMKVFHWWMASLSVLFLFAVPISIRLIPPIDYKIDDLLFNIGVGSVLAGFGALYLWGYQSLDDWLDRRGKERIRKSKRNQ